MRCGPFQLGVVLALAACWLATDVRIDGTPRDVGGPVGSLHGETLAITSSHVGVGTVSAQRKTAAGNGGGRLFVSPRRVAARVESAAAPVATDDSRTREREPLTFTYDATAPPGETADTVL